MDFSAAGNTSTIRSIVLAAEMGMQGAEHKVTGFSGGQRQADGLEVTQLTDKNDVRVFTKCRTQRLVEAVSVAMHLTLVDQ